MEVEDLTLDELRLALAPGIAETAVFDGWSNEALDMAADQLGADRDVADGLGHLGGGLLHAAAHPHAARDGVTFSHPMRLKSIYICCLR